MDIKSFEKLLQKNMDRKEFLLYFGLFFLVLTGVSHILKSFNEPLEATSQKQSQGFGSGAYGGVAERSKYVS